MTEVDELYEKRLQAASEVVLERRYELAYAMAEHEEERRG